MGHVYGTDSVDGLQDLADLPPVDTKRWVSRRKAKVVAAVRSGLLSLNDACRRYNLSVDEFLSWQRMVDRHGVPGLRATRIQHYRQADDDTDCDVALPVAAESGSGGGS
ncbi:MAG: DUF1153 domain-containing protein [Rhodospirillaceae bacterium]|nr:DUF1153 domain-containing protein [Rhodospirillaceae bacterium]